MAASAAMECSCGFLPCICVLEVLEEVQVHESSCAINTTTALSSLAREPESFGVSHLRSLLQQNAMTTCSLCALIPCICPNDNDHELAMPEGAESVDHSANSTGVDQTRREEKQNDEEEEDMDPFGRVPLRKTIIEPCKVLDALQNKENQVHALKNVETKALYDQPQTLHATDAAEVASEPNKPVWVAREIKSKLKAHQVDGVEFLYRHVEANRGCILADFMGLGKTLQVVTVVYSFLVDRWLQTKEAEAEAAKSKQKNQHSELSQRANAPTVLVLSPAICIPNWVNEFRKWLSQDSLKHCKLFTIDNTNALNGRARVFREWKEQGGVLLLGYEMFRSLLNPNVTVALDHDSPPPIQVCTRLSTSTMQITNAVAAKATKVTQEFMYLLCDPGADLVVLDEGHRMKDPSSLLCQSISKIATKRRLVLTGYPVQNSLSEYWCMVNFAREQFLGSYDTFRAVFERPIVEGNVARSQELIEKLKPVVLRRGRKLLNKQLPPKHEWIVYCKLSKLQHELYCALLKSIDMEDQQSLEYLDDQENEPMLVTAKKNTSKNDAKSQFGDLLSTYAVLLQVMNHPDIIHQRLVEEEQTALADEKSGRLTPPMWFDANSTDWGYVPPEKEVEKIQSALEAQRRKLLKQQQQTKALVWAKERLAELQQTQWKCNYMTLMKENSGKMVFLMEILEQSLACGDKVVVFSQSVPTLKIIGAFIRQHPAFRKQVEAGMAATSNHCSTTSNKQLKSGVNGNVTKRTRRDPAGLLRKRKKCKDASQTQERHMPGDPLSAALEKQFFLHIDGSTTGSRRMEILDAFSSMTSQVQILLVSTRAGAEGINLHAANRLVLFDVSWNPSNDHQSMCRSHRIGQSKPVFVYRLVSDGTMERKIYEQQVMKVGLSSSVVDASPTSNDPTGDVENVPLQPNKNRVTFNTKDIMRGFLEKPTHTPSNYQHKCTAATCQLIHDDHVLATSLANANDWIVEVLPVTEPDTEE